MDIEVLKSLLAVAEAGSFSRAGTLLCVSQSAVSKRIRQLEETLAVQLLDRSGPALTLTRAGALVAEKAEIILDAQRDLLNGVEQYRQSQSFSFCCTPSFGISFLPRIVRCFISRHPDISSFNFSFENPTQIMEELRNGSCQIAVVEHCDDFVVEGSLVSSLGDDRMLLVGAPSLGLSRDSVSIDAVLDFTVCASQTGCCCRMMLDSRLQALGKTVEDFSKALIYDDLSLIVKAVLDGDGIAYLSQSVAAEYLAEGKLAAYPVAGLDATFKRSLVAGGNYRPTPETDDLIRIIQEIAGTRQEPV